MSKRRTSMNKIREILRLHERCDLSNRKISKALKISKLVVSQYISDLKALGLKYEDIKEISDEILLEILNKNKRSGNDKYKELLSRFSNYARELKRVGVTKETLWKKKKNRQAPHVFLKKDTRNL